MATGSTRGFLGNYAPLEGEAEYTQKTAATDMMTLTGASGQSGKFLVLQNSSGTAKFSVDASGNTVVAGTLSVTGAVTAGIAGTVTYPSQSAGTASFAVTSLTTGDVVAISSRASANSGIIAVESVQAGTLTLRNGSSETASRVVGYAVVARNAA